MRLYSNKEGDHMERDKWTRKVDKVICKHCAEKGHVMVTTWTEKEGFSFFETPFKDLKKLRGDICLKN